jgi:multisubunit Na+/H+ antiporter MnhG subunit
LYRRAQTLSASFLRAAGILLVALGIVHNVATPHIAQLLIGSPPDVYQRALGPTLLNHFLVGILLIPLGFTTWLAASPANLSQPWARHVLLFNAFVVVTFPVCISLFMRLPEYYHAPLFLTGVVLTAIIAILMIIAIWFLRRS